jgi:uncharacterized membrane protein
VIRVGAAYDLAGAVFAVVSVSAALAPAENLRVRCGRTIFFGLLATSFLFGDRLGDLGDGVLVVALVLVGAFGGMGGGARAGAAPAWAAARAVGYWVFLPILVVPAVTVAGTLVLGGVRVGGAPLVDPKQVTVISLALGAAAALVAAMAIIRPPLTAPATEARRLLEAIGSAAILPQLLAALGAVFILAGVGRAMQTLIARWGPLDDRLAVVCAFCAGMALFTTVLGNAFAAFPVLVAALGAPIIAGRLGGDAAMMGAVGMLSGYCGTLVTPMASFNIVPTALLDLPSGAVIRAQAPTAALVLIFNIVLMWLFVFPR